MMLKMLSVCSEISNFTPSWMIQISTLHHKGDKWTKIVRSHKLNPNDMVSIFCVIEWKKENIVSILEDHLLEMISWVEWQIHDIDADFSYVAEHFNHFIKNIDSDDLTGISLVLWALYKNTLIITTIGNAQALLIEKHGEVSIISVEDQGRYEFHSISSWEIPVWWTVYIANNQLSKILWEDILFEFSELDSTAWINTANEVLRREYSSDVHIFRITNWEIRSFNKKWEGSSGAQIISDKIWNILHSLQSKFIDQEWIQWIKMMPSPDNKKTQYIFLAVWIVLLFILSYSLISAISGIVHTSSTDSRNQLLEAQSLIEQSQKLTNNPTAFSINIKKAEEILFSLRDKKEHMADTQDLLWRIEAMKKEVNDIQSIDMSRYATIMKFNPADISPIGLFERNKKLTLIGKNGAILDYTRWANLPKVLPYPSWEEAIDFDIEENGNFFVLTNNSRILAPRRDELTYVTVSGQDGWEKSSSIKTFNGNLYLISDDRSQIFKHKPGMNGFSPKSAMLSDWTLSWVLDLGIDGGLYILTQNGKIQRYITGKTDIPKSIVINKVPWDYDIGNQEPTSMFVRPNLTYMYILSGNRIWIFQPDAKRFQDISSLNYIAQLEIQTQEEVRDIYIPRDGTIDVVTNLGVYEIGFEIADGKVILR